MKKLRKRNRNKGIAFDKANPGKLPGGLGDISGLLKAAEEAGKAEDRRQVNRRSRTTILQEAEFLIYGPRNKTYRHPTENFNNIAAFWNVYFNAIKVRPGVAHIGGEQIGDFIFNINNIDVAYLTILMKVARGATNQEHEDTIVDIAGYAGCIERIVKNK